MQSLTAAGIAAAAANNASASAGGAGGGGGGSAAVTPASAAPLTVAAAAPAPVADAGAEAAAAARGSTAPAAADAPGGPGERAATSKLQVPGQLPLPPPRDGGRAARKGAKPERVEQQQPAESDADVDAAAVGDEEPAQAPAAPPPRAAASPGPLPPPSSSARRPRAAATAAKAKLASSPPAAVRRSKRGDEISTSSLNKKNAAFFCSPIFTVSDPSPATQKFFFSHHWYTCYTTQHNDRKSSAQTFSLFFSLFSLFFFSGTRERVEEGEHAVVLQAPHDLLSDSAGDDRGLRLVGVGGSSSRGGGGGGSTSGGARTAKAQRRSLASSSPLLRRPLDGRDRVALHEHATGRWLDPPRASASSGAPPRSTRDSPGAASDEGTGRCRSCGRRSCSAAAAVPILRVPSPLLRYSSSSSSSSALGVVERAPRGEAGAVASSAAVLAAAATPAGGATATW